VSLYVFRRHSTALAIDVLANNFCYNIKGRIFAFLYLSCCSYEQIDTLGQNRVLTSEETEDLLGVVTEISSVCQTALRHAILSPLMYSFRLVVASVSVFFLFSSFYIHSLSLSYS